MAISKSVLNSKEVIIISKPLICETGVKHEIYEKVGSQKAINLLMPTIWYFDPGYLKPLLVISCEPFSTFRNFGVFKELDNHSD